MRKIKVAVLVEHGRLEIREHPAPSVKNHDVRIRVEKVGICGSDVHRYESGFAWERLPLVMGHEFSGTVIETGAEAKIALGQPVTVMPVLFCNNCAMCHKGDTMHCLNLTIYGVHHNGALTQEMIVPQHRVRPLLSNMGTDRGAFVEPMAVALHSINQAQMPVGGTVLILGAGSIGMLVLQELKARGAEFIAVTGRTDWKLSLARKLGADLAVNVTKGEKDKLLTAVNSGYEAIFDFVCSSDTIEQAISLARPGASIVLLATPVHPRLTIDYNELFLKELTLAVSRLYSDEEFDQALVTIASRRIQIEPLITHRFSLDDVSEAMKFAQTNRAEVIKVFIEPQRTGSSL